MTEQELKEIKKYMFNAARIQARAIIALVKALGMYSANMQANKLDLPLAYDEQDFLDVIKQEQLDDDSILRVLNP